MVEATVQYRTEFIKYVSGILSPQSCVWVKKLFSSINKMLLTNDIEVCSKVYPMYKNILRFVRDYCDECEPANILLTLYICGIELGVVSLGDEVETYKEFTESVDMEDWALMTAEDIVRVDMRSECALIARVTSIDPDDYPTIQFGGLRAISLLDYMEEVD